MPAPPRSEAELLARAEALAGLAVGEVAAALHIRIPAEPRRAKGYTGMILERALGATAGSRAEPDFPHLGVELKTLPLDAGGRVLETTYVCTAPLQGLEAHWSASWVRRKLARVLWVPIVGAGHPSERAIGAPILWSPSEEEESVLRADWESIAEAISLGETWQMDARRGRALQLRPKAANAAERVRILDDEGEWAEVNPRGFYLRTSFTQSVVRGLR